MRGYRRYSQKRVDAEAVTRAFKELRRQGFMARQNFKCCGSCSGYAIGLEFGSKPALRAKCLGAVTYHAQSAAAMRDGHDLYISFGRIEHFGPDHKTGDGPKYQTPLPTEEVGRRAVAVLRSEGLTVEWDGSEHHTIIVKAIGPKTEAEREAEIAQAMAL